MAEFHTVVSNVGIHDERSILTYVADAAITAADVGKAVELDTSAANKVKLATDNSAIHGRIEAFEDATPGRPALVSVLRRGVIKLVKTASAVSVGASVIGGGSGLVKAAPVVTPTTATPFTAAQNAAMSALSRNVVVEVSGNDLVVELF